jgi:hypothetical protein
MEVAFEGGYTFTALIANARRPAMQVESPQARKTA